MAGTYRLTYDEQQRAKADELARSRLRRLLAVRERDRTLARARARSYQELCDASAAQLRRQLIAALEQQRATELRALQEQCARAAGGLASAHREAAATAGRQAARAEVARATIARRAAEAQRRFEAAVAQVRTAREAELRRALQVLQHRQEESARAREGARAAAGQARAAAAAAATRHAESELAEEQRRRRNMYSQINFRCVLPRVCGGVSLPHAVDRPARQQA